MKEKIFETIASTQTSCNKVLSTPFLASSSNLKRNSLNVMVRGLKSHLLVRHATRAEKQAQNVSNFEKNNFL
jgi:hypothetical protein